MLKHACSASRLLGRLRDSLSVVAHGRQPRPLTPQTTGSAPGSPRQAPRAPQPGARASCRACSAVAAASRSISHLISLRDYMRRCREMLSGVHLHAGTHASAIGAAPGTGTVRVTPRTYYHAQMRMYRVACRVADMLCPAPYGCPACHLVSLVELLQSLLLPPCLAPRGQTSSCCPPRLTVHAGTHAPLARYRM